MKYKLTSIALTAALLLTSCRQESDVASYNVSQAAHNFEVNRRVVFADRFYPSTKTCSACGDVKDIALSERTYRCGCGLVLNRDMNAALNLKQLYTDDSSGIYASGDGKGTTAQAVVRQIGRAHV